jgi:hypothetical protein
LEERARSLAQLDTLQGFWRKNVCHPAFFVHQITECLILKQNRESDHLVAAPDLAMHFFGSTSPAALLALIGLLAEPDK